jgi:hypothetical protein
MQDFIGLCVNISLQNRTNLTGTIQSVDQTLQVLTLSQVTLTDLDQVSQFPIYQVNGKDILDLNILSQSSLPESSINTNITSHKKEKLGKKPRKSQVMTLFSTHCGQF